MTRLTKAKVPNSSITARLCSVHTTSPILYAIASVDSFFRSHHAPYQMLPADL